MSRFFGISGEFVKKKIPTTNVVLKSQLYYFEANKLSKSNSWFEMTLVNTMRRIYSFFKCPIFALMFHPGKLTRFVLLVFHSDESLRKSVDSMGPQSPDGDIHETILGGNGESEDDDIPPPLTKTEQELLNNCLYSSGSLNAANETVQLVCVEMPTSGELNEEVIVVKKEQF